MYNSRMASTVRYTDKSGETASATFPTRALAESYARTVKAARIEDDALDAAPMNVRRCPEGTAEAQHEASRAYHAMWRSCSPTLMDKTFEKELAEHEAEQMAEHFGAARCAGQAMEDAWADWDYMHGQAPNGLSNRQTRRMG